jgi:uncharacterized protein YqcC (DUF446 family)
MSMPTHEAVAGQIGRIEAEMRKIGYWREEPLPLEMYEFTQAFAMDTMPFAYWLQFIFIPRVKSIVEERSEFPPASHVAAQAVREFDGATEADELLSLLSEFDGLFR